jgi:hypothetical protein
MYTAEEVINYFKDNIGVKKTRKRAYLDKRNYVIGILYYHFRYSEIVLEGMFGIDRSTVNYGKKMPHALFKHKDADFIKNTIELVAQFPFEFPKNEGHNAVTREYMVRISLDRDTYHKLVNYSKLKDMYINRATKELLTKAIKLWEE